MPPFSLRFVAAAVFVTAVASCTSANPPKPSIARSTAQSLSASGTEQCDTLTASFYDSISALLANARAAAQANRASHPSDDAELLVAAIDQAAQVVGDGAAWMRSVNLDGTNPSVASNTLANMNAALVHVLSAATHATNSATASASTDAEYAFEMLAHAATLMTELGTEGGRCDLDVYAKGADSWSDWRKGEQPETAAPPSPAIPASCGDIRVGVVAPLLSLFSSSMSYEQAEIAAHTPNDALEYAQFDIDYVNQEVSTVETLKDAMGSSGLSAGDPSTASSILTAMGTVVGGITIASQEATYVHAYLPGPSRSAFEDDVAAVDYATRLAFAAGRCAIAAKTPSPPACFESSDANGSTTIVLTDRASYTTSKSTTNGGTDTTTEITVDGSLFVDSHIVQSSLGVVDSTVTYGPLVQGIGSIHAQSDDGVTYYGTVDGRPMKPFVVSRGTTPQIFFANGEPVPDPIVSDDVMGAVIAVSQKRGASCGKGNAHPAKVAARVASARPSSVNVSPASRWAAHDSARKGAGIASSRFATTHTLGLEPTAGYVPNATPHSTEGNGDFQTTLWDWRSPDCKSCEEACGRQVVSWFVPGLLQACEGECFIPGIGGCMEHVCSVDSSCDSGETCCGSDLCCFKGAVCGSDDLGVCCPGDFPVACGNTTASACFEGGSTCCGDTGVACGPGTACVNVTPMTAQCCPNDHVTNDGQCCPETTCNGVCCFGGTCQNGQCCQGKVAPNGQCCDLLDNVCNGACCKGSCTNGSCCPSGQACGSTCCATGSACLNPQLGECGACASGFTVCNPTMGASDSAPAMCCREGVSCSKEGCCQKGEIVCSRDGVEPVGCHTSHECLE